MRLRLASALLVAALLPALHAAREPVAVTAADAGREIALARGDLLQVRLEAQPSTGYLWEVTRARRAVLERRGQDVFEPAPGGLLGGAQIQVLQFRAVGPGETRLALAYRRPWEKSAPPERSMVFRVRVR